MPSFDYLFKDKQRSYKMILILSMLNLLANSTGKLSMNDVAQEVRRLLVEQEKSGVVDSPPKSIGTQWAEASLMQMKQVLDSPINTLLSKVVEIEDDIIGFRESFIRELGDNGLTDLRKSAELTLSDYWSELAIKNHDTTIHGLITFIMNNYIDAKQSQFPNHEVYKILTKELSAKIQSMTFVPEEIKVKGSVGQGNWATVPWLALLDKRVTTTTRDGVYIVYLFSEDMATCYLTLNQGVTKIIEEMGRVKGYSELKSRVGKLRDELEIFDMTIDDEIWLSENGLGRDYQASTIAYIKYDRDSIPDDAQLLDDLRRALFHYHKYVKATSNLLLLEFRTLKIQLIYSIEHRERIAKTRINTGFLV